MKRYTWLVVLISMGSKIAASDTDKSKKIPPRPLPIGIVLVIKMYEKTPELRTLYSRLQNPEIIYSKHETNIMRIFDSFARGDYVITDKDPFYPETLRTQLEGYEKLQQRIAWTAYANHAGLRGSLVHSKYRRVVEHYYQTRKTFGEWLDSAEHAPKDLLTVSLCLLRMPISTK